MRVITFILGLAVILLMLIDGFETILQPRPMARPQGHWTLSLFERYRLASDGTLAERHTWHTIAAREAGMTSYFFNHEPSASGIEVVHGGRLGRHYEYGTACYHRFAAGYDSCSAVWKRSASGADSG